MNLRHQLVFGLIFAIAIGLASPDIIRSEDSVDTELERKKQEIEELQQKLVEVRGQSQTLSSTIAYLNNRINLTEAQISQTQTQLRILNTEIADLNVQIAALDTSLEEVTELLLNRINNTYKRSRINPVYSLISSTDLAQMFSRYKYLQLSARNDKEIIFQMEETRLNFDNQKRLKEEKQVELDELTAQLEAQQVTLADQQSEKQALLELTKNDEKRFQAELAIKRSELEAIQSIIAGKGEETKVGEVNQGDKIAQVIAGPSTCSTGAHLHFEVAKSGTHRNPAEYLSDKSVVWNNGSDGAFGFSGSWPWPLNDTIRITQGYGMTSYASIWRAYGGGPHTGIDMVNNSDYTVKAVQKGTLYRGSVSCRNAPLRYVRVEHEDGISSYYLHINY